MVIKRTYLLNIKDKIMLSKTRFCPPHYFPHKLPIGDKVADEPCHLHKRAWRMAHHIPFCKLLKCPNYSFMMAQYKKHKKKIKC